jgi:uncharacterized membrane protein YgcG
MKNLILFFLLFASGLTTGYGQTYNFTGRVVDATDTSALIGVAILVVNTADTTLKTGTVTDPDGFFTIALMPGSYTLRFDYVGYKQISRTTTIAGADVDMGTLKMLATAKELKSVTIAAKEIRGQQKGDTSQFNANAYKTNKDATAEELVGKMPGVTSDNNGVKVNGEAVQQIYVDGKPFFGNDPTLALRNLPAEVIDNIQIFDRLSDQAAFTGFDDGSAQKTMNINTRKNKSEGYFGKVYAGYGTDDRYIAGGNLNIFHGEQRISILALSNNINQQNFSPQDLLGVSSGSTGGGGRGGFGGGSGGFGGGGRGGGGSGGAGNFLTGQQGGIQATNSVGVNYADKWGKKVKISGSYFFNGSDNTKMSEISRIYTDSSYNVYNEHTDNETRNYNHRVNLRLEYVIDSSNTIIFTPGISFQDNRSGSGTSATDSIRHLLYSTTLSRTTAFNTGYNSSNNLLLQHKFNKVRRTISLNLNTNLNEKSGNGTYYSDNRYYMPDTGSLYDQHYDLMNNSNTYSANVTYTEPSGKRGQWLLSYNPSVSLSHADKETYDKSSTSSEYTNLNAYLSNKYDNTYTTQKGGLSYRIGDRLQNVLIGLNAQSATLDGTQTYPYNLTINRDFFSLLPNATYNLRYNDGRNLRIMYRTSTNAPSISQLQNVVDISNPLLLKTGNAGLKQDYGQTFIVRYGATKAQTGKNFFVNAFINYVDNYIGNATYMPYRGDSLFTDAVTKDSILIRRGSQLSRPVNLDGYWSARTFVTYGMPVTLLKSNLNFNGGVNFNRTPGIVNQVINYSNNYIPSFGAVLSSNISENFDFTLSYQGNYNIVQNSSSTAASTNYYSHFASLRLNWVFLKNVVFNTNITHNYYTAFSNTGNQSFILWTSYVGYKMLKDKGLEARITAFDLLNQNKSITRTVSANYIENDLTQVLKQYFMLQLTYTIRNFKGQLPEENRRPFDGMMPPPPGGGRPPEGGR